QEVDNHIDECSSMDGVVPGGCIARKLLPQEAGKLDCGNPGALMHGGFAWGCLGGYTTIDHSPHICQNEYNKYMYSFEVMSVATSLRPTDELEQRIKKLAATTGRSQSFYINQMIEDGIDRVEQIYGILHETEQYQAGDLHTYSSDDLRHELGLER